jgi:hypothetical protein
MTDRETETFFFGPKFIQVGEMAKLKFYDNTLLVLSYAVYCLS